MYILSWLFLLHISAAETSTVLYSVSVFCQCNYAR